jgi:hypothetical protein
VASFDKIDHETLLNIVERDIKDGRFINLLRGLLKAGYMEGWNYHKTYSGTPQGGIISPLLANIYMNEFDSWVANKLIPKYTTGKKRRTNPEYHKLANQAYKIRKGQSTGNLREIKKRMRRIPSQVMDDPQYRRLKYIRYADDTLFGLTGSRQDAEKIKREIASWLQNNLKLTLSPEKTLITHAKTETATYLGYELSTMQKDYQLDSRKKRNSNGRISLRVPVTVIKEKSKEYRTHDTKLVLDSDYDIVTKYQAIYRGLVNYYIMADNVCHLYYVMWKMQGSECVNDFETPKLIN